MAGVRISGIPKKAEEKQIKIHFSKPQNGGGFIKKIYYPLFNNDAVIIYQDPEVVDSLLQNDHVGVMGRGRHPVGIHRLPEHSVFTSMQARVSPDASVLLQTSPALLDEFRYNEEIDVDFDQSTGTYVLSGNWYQLEWAWTYLDAFIQQQEIIQDEIKHQPFRNNASPMDAEDGGWSETGAITGSALDRYDTKDVKSAFYKEQVTPERTPPRGRRTVAKTLTESSTKLGERTRREEDSPDTRQRDAHAVSTGGRRRLPSPVNSDEEDDHLDFRNVSNRKDDSLGTRQRDESLLTGEYKRLSPTNSDNEDDQLDLRGTGYTIPDASIPMSLQSVGKGRRSDQENTFEEFSGLGIQDRSAGSRDNSARPKPKKSYEADRSLTDPKSYGTEQTGTRRSMDVSPDRDQAPQAKSSQKFQSLPVSAATYSVSRDNAVTTSTVSSSKRSGDTYNEDHMQFRFTLKGLDVVVLHGDLTKADTDAIVNPANSSLEHWGGASYAISRAAGTTLDKECREFIAKNGYLKTSEVMHTRGGNLKALCVLHTCGPMWFDKLENAKDKVAYELTCTFLNCLIYADKLALGSLSVPAISTGVFGVPLDICVRSFLDALLIFTYQRNAKNLKNIRLINKDPEATVTSIVLLRTALEGDVETLSSEAIETFTRWKAKELDLPKGRQERMGSYGRDTSLKSSFSSSLYQRTSSASPSEEQATRTPPRRSSSLNRISPRTTTETTKDDFARTGERTSPGSGNTADRNPRSSNRTGVDKKPDSEHSYQSSYSSSTAKGTKSRDDYMSFLNTDTDIIKDRKTSSNVSESVSKTDSEKDYLSKYKGSVGMSSGNKPYSEKEIMARTTPYLKQSLMTSGTGDYKLKGTKKPGGADSPTGKVRARREYDEDRDQTTDKETYANTRTPALPSRTRNTDEFGFQSLPLNIEQSQRGQISPSKSDEKEKCMICLDTPRRPKTLEVCKHTFCGSCIEEYFKKSKPSCPVCGTIYGKLRGTQPRDGKMEDSVKHNVFLPGYEKADGAIVIKYQFPAGIQKAYHPNPGRPYKGTQRTAYLPNNREGKEVLGLLRRAFDARLVFTVGDSRTTGKEGVLTWNDIHHKTNIYGGPEHFGYPDPSYLTRVKQELADKGITTV